MEPSTPPSGPTAPPPEPEPPGRTAAVSTAEILVGSLLAAVVTLLFAGNALVQPIEPAADTAPGQRFDLRLQAQYELGVRQLFPPSGGSIEALGVEEASARRLDGLADGARERIALAPVLGRLAADPQAGDERAREILAALADDQSLDEATRADASVLLGIYRQPPEPPDAGQRAALLAAYGWFAELAFDRLDDAPSAALERARTVATVLLVCFVALLAVLAAGVCAALVLGRRLARGELTPRYPDDTASAEQPRLPYLETALLFLVALTVLGAASTLASEATGSRWLLLLNWLIVPVLLWPRLRGHSMGDLRAALGWHAGRGVLVEAGCGLLGYLAAMPLLACGLAVTLVVSRFAEQTPYHPIVDWLSDAGVADVTVVLLLAVVWAPLVEESLFRGSLYHYLRGRLGVVGAALTVSLAFAAIHPQGAAGVPFLAALALSLALVREWRGSIVASVTLHMVHNGLATLILLFLLAS